MFWGCPGAQAAVRVLSENLPRVDILPFHVWLLSPPCAEIREEVWWAACLCALGAMPKLKPEGLGRVGLLQELARSKLRDGLEDFVASQGPDPAWARSLTPAHPLVALGAEGRLRCSLIGF